MPLANRCVYCHHIIWPWNRFGWTIRYAAKMYHHTSCYRLHYGAFFHDPATSSAQTGEDRQATQEPL